MASPRSRAPRGVGRRPPELWIADTGCAYDLIGLNDVTQEDKVYMREAAKRMLFHSAGGEAACDQVLPFYNKSFKERVSPFVMANSPPVLSVGRRLMDELSLIHI